MNPKISVIIPTFNAGATLQAALDSVLAQSYAGFEVRIMDGASSDNTASIAKEYASRDARIHWASEPDGGIYDAMNKGIEKARGEWIYFLGSDDTLYNTSVFEVIVNTAANHPQAGMVYGNVLLSASIGFNHDSLIFAGEFSSNRLLQMNLCHQAVFYSRTLFARFGKFNTRYRLLADWDFNLRCFNRAGAVYTDCIVANFSAGASSGQSKDLFFEKDWLHNLLFVYPYNLELRWYKKWKRGLTKLVIGELSSLHFRKAFKAARILAHQLKPAERRTSELSF